MKDLWRRPWFGPLVALLLVYALFCALTPETFARSINLLTMTRQTVVVALAAVGMTLVMVMGGIDLSVGSVVALTTVGVARALQYGASPTVAVLLALGGACAAGAVNGSLTTRLGITPFIVTLGTMSLLRGAAKGLADEQKIDANPQGLEDLMGLGQGQLLPTGVWVMIAVALAAAGLLYRTRLGRHVVAIGSNSATARLCGVRVPRVTVLVYALCGGLAGLAGVMEFSTLTVGDPTDSIGLELEVIASVVIGGGSLSGGQGSIAGSVIGALLMTVIKTGCTHVGLPNWVQEILTGVIIVLAVGLDALRSRRS
jgi:ribose transport system permease protein